MFPLLTGVQGALGSAWRVNCAVFLSPCPRLGMCHCWNLSPLITDSVSDRLVSEMLNHPTETMSGSKMIRINMCALESGDALTETTLAVLTALQSYTSCNCRLAMP